MSKDFFDKLEDEDFYSDKLNHIYFEGEVNEETVNKLVNDIRIANQTIFDEKTKIYISPKPICIHISSIGGSGDFGFRMMNVFKETRVPICTLVDNYSASAATFLSIVSPYRVGTKYSYTLIHQYSRIVYGNRNMIDMYLKDGDDMYKKIINMYLKKTKFNKKELSELLLHDLWLDYKICYEKNIYDRIIDIKDNKKKIENIPFDILIKSINLNNLYLTCDNNKKEFDLLLKSSEYTKPIIIYSKNLQCSENYMYYYLDCLSLINRIKSFKVSTYAVINTRISLDDLLPLLYCDKIYMYDNVSVLFNMIYFKNNSLLLSDSIKNTELMINTIKEILKEKTKIPNEIINNINNKLLILSPSECLKYKLCHEIIKSY